MYFFFDAAQMIVSIGGIVYSIAKKKWYIGVASGIFFFIYPILNELIYNVFTKIFGKKQTYNPQPKSRIVYSPDYNLSFCGLEKLHPFDSQKYANVVRFLLLWHVIKKQDLIEPQNRVSRSILLEKLSASHLIKLNYSLYICKCIEMPLFFLPAFLLRWRVLNPMLKATEGTLIACELANKFLWSINLSGGYHHACCSQGGGFCVYADITLAVHYVRTRLNRKKVMIIDLDAHQGNGHQRDHLGDEDCFIVDCYNHWIYPNDTYAKQAIDLDISVRADTSDEEYLDNLKAIEKVIQKKEFVPEFIVYNAGTDTLVGDPLGGLNLSKECHVRRDEYVIGLAVKYNIPTIMVLSGGYQESNAEVIAESVKNLLTKFDKSNKH